MKLLLATLAFSVLKAAQAQATTASADPSYSYSYSFSDAPAATPIGGGTTDCPLITDADTCNADAACYGWLAGCIDTPTSAGCTSNTEQADCTGDCDWYAGFCADLAGDDGGTGGGTGGGDVTEWIGTYEEATEMICTDFDLIEACADFEGTGMDCISAAMANEAISQRIGKSCDDPCATGVYNTPEFSMCDVCADAIVEAVLSCVEFFDANDYIEVVFSASMDFEGVVVPSDPEEKSFMLSVLAEAIATSSGSDSVIIISIDGTLMMMDSGRRLDASAVVFEAKVVVAVPEGQTSAEVANAAAATATTELNNVVTGGTFADQMNTATQSVVEKAQAEGMEIPEAVQQAVAASIADIVPDAAGATVDADSVVTEVVVIEQDPTDFPTPTPDEEEDPVEPTLDDAAGFTAKAGTISVVAVTLAAMLM